MKNKLAITRGAVLLIAGSLLILIAAFITTSPVAFYASNEIELGANVSLLNELKAPAGFLLVAGIFMVVAVFIRSLATTAMLLGAMIYLSYAAARFISVGVDGLPAEGLVQAAALEAVIGAACLALLAQRAPAGGAA